VGGGEVIVADTHAWIWWLSDPQRLSARARASLEEADRIGVSAISLWEVSMLVASGRIEVDPGVGTWLRRALAADKIELLPLSVEVSVEGAALLQEMGGDPADWLIVATARQEKARLVTKDARIRRTKQVATVW
jgi:PIN domain nuclease of toxin-antitoxin system